MQLPKKKYGRWALDMAMTPILFVGREMPQTITPTGANYLVQALL